MNRNMAQDILNMQMDKYCVLSKLMLQSSASQPVLSGSQVAVNSGRNIPVLS